MQLKTNTLLKKQILISVSSFHNIGVYYKNLKVSGWIKDKTSGFVMPWSAVSNYDYTIEFGNYGFHVDSSRISK